MVLTKSEEFSNQLSSQSQEISELKTLITEMKSMVGDLKSTLTAKIDTLTDKTTTLEKRIDKVNTDISSDVKRLEKRIADDITDLKDSDKMLVSTLNEFKEDQTKKVVELTNELSKSKSLLADQSLELQTQSNVVLAQSKKIVSLEKECYRGLQHGRGFNIEIDGIPRNVGDDPGQLEEAALKIFEAINVDLSEDDIDTIHRLPSKRTPKPTIIRFVSRKSVREIHRNKNKLKDLSDLQIDIPGLNNESRIFIRASQCAYYKNLAYNCRVLKREGLISKVLTGKDGRITILMCDGKYLQVNHETVLRNTFKNFNNFNFDFNDFEDDENE